MMRMFIGRRKTIWQDNEEEENNKEEDMEDVDMDEDYSGSESAEGSYSDIGR